MKAGHTRPAAEFLEELREAFRVEIAEEAERDGKSILERLNSQHSQAFPNRSRSTRWKPAGSPE